MITFDDFDAWGEAVSGASLQLVCDAVETPRWTLGILDLGGVVLQMAVEGGGNLCYGANTHPGPLLFVPLSHPGGHFVNGAGLDDESLFVIPRGADFSIRVRRRAHAWCSVALPDGVDVAACGAVTSTKIACAPGSLPALRMLVATIFTALQGSAAGTVAHRLAGLELLSTTRACLPVAGRARPRPGRPQLDRRVIIRRSMETLEAAPTLPTAAELARSVGVNGRTLLRAFQETFGIPPKQYLLLRELHRIRRELVSGAPADATVADVLVRNGIWEFGRFAGRYRSRFGESPSETLRRGRAGCEGA
ncbi:MAG: helix-turn-helix domain-containing protein [Planctomycetia bacterium]